MTFRENPRFPEILSYGAKSTPAYQTTIIPRKSGHETRNADWSRSKRAYDVAHNIRTQAEYELVLDFFMAVAEGRAYGFRFKDWLDYRCVLSRGRMGTGVGTGDPTYQLVKRYLSGAFYKDRDIRKPVAGTVVGYRGATPLVVGSGAGQIAIATDTGLITFVADLSLAITGHTPGASHVFTTASDLGLGIGDKVRITGVTGTASAVLNNITHNIANKTGSGPFTWTLSTVTSSLTASGGTGHKYPQAADVLTWSGEFDVPCRMGSDELPGVLDKGNIISITSIPIVEVRDED